MNTPTPKLISLIENGAAYLLAAYALITPLLFLPIFAGNVFDFPKWILTLFIALLSLILWAVYQILQKKIVFPNRMTAITLGLFFVATLISIYFAQSHKVLALQGKGSLLLAFVIILWSHLAIIKNKTYLSLYALIVSSFILSWLELFSFFEIFKKITTEPVLGNKFFTPIGSQWALINFIIVLLPVTIIMGFQQKKTVYKILLFLTALMQLLAIGMAVSQVLPGQATAVKFLPFASGWSIAVDQLKNGQTALFGVGPDNFASAFSRFRPSNLNQSTFWNIRFPASSNEWLNLFTTMGICGLGTFCLYLLHLLKNAWSLRKENPYAPALISGLGIIIAQMIFMPANFSHLLLLFIFSFLILKSDQVNPWEIPSTAFHYLLGGLFILLPLGISYFVFKMALAELYYGRSLVYAAANRGTDTYNYQVKAIQTNPYVYHYHVSYSNTNLAIANSLAAKKDLNDNDKKQVSQLILQAVDEAKKAVMLTSQNSAVWANLANIYRQLINIAKGSDQWAITTYIQAIKLDSTNPQLRLDFGGLLLSLKQYDEAIGQYKQAVALKPDFANAYYNLSFIYQHLKQYDKAYQSMQNVTNLVDANSADHEKAMQELDKLKELLPPEMKQATTSAAKRDSQLQKPEPIPSPQPDKQVQFDQKEVKELEPPVVNSENKEATKSALPVVNKTATPSAQPSPKP